MTTPLDAANEAWDEVQAAVEAGWEVVGVEVVKAADCRTARRRIEEAQARYREAVRRLPSYREVSDEA